MTTTSSPRFNLPMVGSNNPGGYDSSHCNSSGVLPFINSGSEIVYQPVHNDYSSKPGKRIKLHDDENDLVINDIRLVHGYSQNETLYIVSGDGKLYQVINNKSLKRVLLLNNDHLEVLQIASYTEAVLFLVRDKLNDEYYIYGQGHNGYFRMTHTRKNDEYVNDIETMFEPRNELTNIGIPYVINHIGCCYSFSCCIINETIIHFTGQNWLSNGKTDEDGYFTWPIEIQDFKQPVTKLECGDFHVVALLKDGTVAVGGSNSSNQCTTAPTNSTFNLPFTFIFPKIIGNIFSGSNTVIYQLKSNHYSTNNNGNSKSLGGGSEGFYYYGAKSFDFIECSNNIQNDLNTGDKVKKILSSHESDSILEQQFTRDFFLHRYENTPEKIHLDGSSYYGSTPFNNSEFNLESLMPFEEFNKGVYPNYRKSEFYKNIKLIVQPKGLFCICDYGRGLASKMFKQLLKSTNYSEENNRLLLDIKIQAQH